MGCLLQMQSLNKTLRPWLHSALEIFQGSWVFSSFLTSPLTSLWLLMVPRVSHSFLGNQHVPPPPHVLVLSPVASSACRAVKMRVGMNSAKFQKIPSLFTPPPTFALPSLDKLSCHFYRTSNFRWPYPSPWLRCLKITVHTCEWP